MAPDRRASEEGDDRLRHVGQVADNTVSGGHAEAPEAGGDPGNLLRQLRVREGHLRPGLRARDDRRTLVRRAASVTRYSKFGVVEGGSREPTGTGHPVARKNGTRLLVERQLEPACHAAPEALEILYGPLPRRVIRGELATAGAFCPVEERAHAGGRPSVRARFPDELPGPHVGHAGFAVSFAPELLSPTARDPAYGRRASASDTRTRCLPARSGGRSRG